MAIPPIGQDEFLKQLNSIIGRAAATKGAAAASTKGAGLLKNYDAQVEARRAENKRRADMEGWERTLEDVLTNSKVQSTIKTIAPVVRPLKPLAKPVLTSLVAIDAPHRYTVSAVREIVDVLDNDPKTKASWSDWYKQGKDIRTGYGHLFPQKGWGGRINGFVMDLALDPINWATLGRNIPKSIATKGLIGALGTRNVSSRAGREALARYSNERLLALKASGYIHKGKPLTDDFINGVTKKVASKGKSYLPGFLRDDIGIHGPGVYYFGSRVKVPFSGPIGFVLERGLANLRVGLIKPLSIPIRRAGVVKPLSINPIAKLHKAITPDMDFQMKYVEAGAVRAYRVGLANGTLSPKESAQALMVLKAADMQRMSNTKIKETLSQEGMAVMKLPDVVKYKDVLHRVMQNILTPAEMAAAQLDGRQAAANEVNNLLYRIYAKRVKPFMHTVDPGYAVGEKDDYFPFMLSDDGMQWNERVNWLNNTADSLNDVLLDGKHHRAPSFRRRRTQEGNWFWGHILKEADLNTDRLNYLARNPGSEPLPPGMPPEFAQALDFDLFETDVMKIIPKYIYHASEEYGIGAFIKTLKDDGRFMGSSLQGLGMTPSTTNVVAGAPAMQIARINHTILSKVNQTIAQTIDDITAGSVPTPTALAPASEAVSGGVPKVAPITKTVPMKYSVPLAGVRNDLKSFYPNGTTTAQLIADGHRTATTRLPFGDVGDVIRFAEHGPDGELYIITDIKKPNLTTPEGRLEWEQLEGWDLNYIDANPRLRSQVYGSNVVQTVFKKYVPIAGAATPKERLVYEYLGDEQLRRVIPVRGGKKKYAVLKHSGFHDGPVVKGKGTAPELAMRRVSNSSITEFVEGTPSSARYTHYELGNKHGKKKVIMLARSSDFKNKPLAEATKKAILDQHKKGKVFVVGDVPDLDAEFIQFLDEINASYTIYHAGPKPRIDSKLNTWEAPQAFPVQQVGQYSGLSADVGKLSAADIDVALPEITKTIAKLSEMWRTVLEHFDASNKLFSQLDTLMDAQPPGNITTYRLLRKNYDDLQVEAADMYRIMATIDTLPPKKQLLALVRKLQRLPLFAQLIESKNLTPLKSVDGGLAISALDAPYAQSSPAAAIQGLRQSVADYQEIDISGLSESDVLDMLRANADAFVEKSNMYVRNTQRLMGVQNEIKLIGEFGRRVPPSRFDKAMRFTDVLNMGDLDEAMTHLDRLLARFDIEIPELSKPDLNMMTGKFGGTSRVSFMDRRKQFAQFLKKKDWVTRQYYEIQANLYISAVDKFEFGGGITQTHFIYHQLEDFILKLRAAKMFGDVVNKNVPFGQIVPESFLSQTIADLQQPFRHARMAELEEVRQLRIVLKNVVAKIGDIEGVGGLKFADNNAVLNYLAKELNPRGLELLKKYADSELFKQFFNQRKNLHYDKILETTGKAVRDNDIALRADKKRLREILKSRPEEAKQLQARIARREVFSRDMRGRLDKFDDIGEWYSESNDLADIFESLWTTKRLQTFLNQFVLGENSYLTNLENILVRRIEHLGDLPSAQDFAQMRNLALGDVAKMADGIAPVVEHSAPEAAGAISNVVKQRLRVPAGVGELSVGQQLRKLDSSVQRVYKSWVRVRRIKINKLQKDVDALKKSIRLIQSNKDKDYESVRLAIESVESRALESKYGFEFAGISQAGKETIFKRLKEEANPWSLNQRILDDVLRFGPGLEPFVVGKEEFVQQQKEFFEFFEGLGARISNSPEWADAQSAAAFDKVRKMPLSPSEAYQLFELFMKPGTKDLWENIPLSASGKRPWLRITMKELSDRYALTMFKGGEFRSEFDELFGYSKIAFEDVYAVGHEFLRRKYISAAENNLKQKWIKSGVEISDTKKAAALLEAQIATLQKEVGVMTPSRFVSGESIDELMTGADDIDLINVLRARVADMEADEFYPIAKELENQLTVNRLKAEFEERLIDWELNDGYVGFQEIFKNTEYSSKLLKAIYEKDINAGLIFPHFKDYVHADMLDLAAEIKVDVYRVLLNMPDGPKKVLLQNIYKIITAGDEASKYVVRGLFNNSLWRDAAYHNKRDSMEILTQLFNTLSADARMLNAPVGPEKSMYMDNFYNEIAWGRTIRSFNISAEDVAARIRKYLYETNPGARRPDESRIELMKAVEDKWNASDANKWLTKISDAKKLILDLNIKLQFKDPVRVADIAASAEKQLAIGTANTPEWNARTAANVGFRMTEISKALERMRATWFRDGVTSRPRQWVPETEVPERFKTVGGKPVKVPKFTKQGFERPIKVDDYTFTDESRPKEFEVIVDAIPLAGENITKYPDYIESNQRLRSLIETDPTIIQAINAMNGERQYSILGRDLASDKVDGFIKLGKEQEAAEAALASKKPAFTGGDEDDLADAVGDFAETDMGTDVLGEGLSFEDATPRVIREQAYESLKYGSFKNRYRAMEILRDNGFRFRVVQNPSWKTLKDELTLVGLPNALTGTLEELNNAMFYKNIAPMMEDVARLKQHTKFIDDTYLSSPLELKAPEQLSAEISILETYVRWGVESEYTQQGVAIRELIKQRWARLAELNPDNTPTHVLLAHAKYARTPADNYWRNIKATNAAARKENAARRGINQLERDIEEEAKNAIDLPMEEGTHRDNALVDNNFRESILEFHRDRAVADIQSSFDAREAELAELAWLDRFPTYTGLEKRATPLFDSVIEPDGTVRQVDKGSDFFEQNPDWVKDVDQINAELTEQINLKAQQAAAEDRDRYKNIANRGGSITWVEKVSDLINDLQRSGAIDAGSPVIKFVDDALALLEEAEEKILKRPNKQLTPTETVLVDLAEKEVERVALTQSAAGVTDALARQLPEGKAAKTGKKVTEKIADTVPDYSGDYANVGKGTPTGDGKDIAMREIADSSIVELASDRPSSSLTTLKTLGPVNENSKIVMLARNGALRNQPLRHETVVAIQNAHIRGAKFVVGDMPGVDSQFVNLLDEIGANYTIYHTGNTPRISKPKVSVAKTSDATADRLASIKRMRQQKLAKVEEVPKKTTKEVVEKEARDEVAVQAKIIKGVGHLADTYIDTQTGEVLRNVPEAVPTQATAGPGVAKPITSFKGTWLSNFQKVKIVDDSGVVYPSVEHYYQAMKTEDIEVRRAIAALKSAAQAKYRGRKLPAMTAEKKLEVMRKALEQKFAPGSRFAKLLLKTGDAELVEGNTWGDIFWGVSNGRGENHLGKMLMDIRASLRASISAPPVAETPDATATKLARIQQAKAQKLGLIGEPTALPAAGKPATKQPRRGAAQSATPVASTPAPAATTPTPVSAPATAPAVAAAGAGGMSPPAISIPAVLGGGGGPIGPFRAGLLAGWERLDKSLFPTTIINNEKYVDSSFGKSMAEIWKNATFFEKTENLQKLTDLIGPYNKFYKSYILSTPGFQTRNLLANAVQYILAGGKIQNWQPGMKHYIDWIKAYDQGVTWADHLRSLSAAERVHVVHARDALAMSGGAIFGDVFHAIRKGSAAYDNKFTRFFGKWAQRSDNMSRFALAYDQSIRGSRSIEMSSALIQKFYIDYEDISQLDRYMQLFMPFWIWTSRNYVTQLQNIWLNPKPYNTYMKFKRNFMDDEKEDELPKYAASAGGFGLPGSIGLMAVPDLNFNRAKETGEQLFDPASGIGNLNPLLRVPIEQIAGKSFYTGKEFEGGDDRLLNMLRNIVPPASQANRLVGSEGDNQLNAWLGYLGSPIKKIPYYEE